jgi:hypothetical protein
MDHVLGERWRLKDLLIVMAGIDVVFVGVHCAVGELERRDASGVIALPGQRRRSGPSWKGIPRPEPGRSVACASHFPSIGHGSDREESGRFATQSCVVIAVDSGRPRDRPRFDESLDQEAGVVQLLTGSLERCQPVPHPPAAAPYFFDHPHVEVVPAVTQPVAGRVLPRQHECSAWTQDSTKLA